MHTNIWKNGCLLCHQGVESEEHMFAIVLSFMKYGDITVTSNKALAHSQGIGI